VTDPEEARQALVRSEERHRLVASVTREVIWDADLTTGRTTWSGAVRHVFGLPDDVVDIDLEWWLDRIHPDDVAAVVGARAAALASTNGRFTHEYRLRDESDRYVTVSAQGRILRNAHGDAVRFLGSMLDVTHFRRQEEELQLARRLAEEANEAKSQFLANMSHELRTPLTSVIAGTEMAMDGPLSPPQLRLLERVSRSGERLLKLVNDLLDFSAIEAGDIRMDEVLFDPQTVVQHAAAWARDACEKHDLEFELTMDPLPQPLLGDPDRLAQVLSNLLENAVKFTSAGSVRLVVAAVGEELGRVRLRCTVQDTGIGVAPEHHVEIFTSFSQADPSITRRFGGNGLGLAISKEIVELLGGSIGIDSEAGRGSSVFFEIPYARPDTRDPGT
jgi:two-component system sensor histidine kinase/response regulator